MHRRRIPWVGGSLSIVLLVAVAFGWQLVGHDTESDPGAAAQAPSASRAARGQGAGRRPLGGDIDPETTVWDPYPTLNGVALDPENNRVVVSDLNRHGLLIYDRTANSHSGEPVEPLRHIMGPATELGYVAGVAMDPDKREVYVAENDAWGVRVFSYDDQGNAAPRRILATPHQTWGISLSRPRRELAVSVEELNALLVYRQDAANLDPPLRVIRGNRTGLADPHGIHLDAVNREIVVANHGNWTTYSPNSNHDALPAVIPPSAGRFDLPSIRVYAAEAQGDVPPIRTIQGDRTTLDWPMAVDVDASHDEIAVANFGRDSIAIFNRREQGDVRPSRVIRGDRTRIVGPVGVAIDTKNDEIWVANYGDHTALVFPRSADGDVAPRRIVRNAPDGAATCGFTDASAAAYDSKRREILVAN